MSFEVVLLLALPAQACVGIRSVNDAERLVVLRLGRVHSVLQPGLRWILPGVDRTVRVDLSRTVPGWQPLSAQAPDRQLIDLARSGQLPTAT